MAHNIDVTIECDDWKTILSNKSIPIENIVRQTLEAAEKPETLEDKEMDVSVVLSNDENVQNLNRDYRNKDKPTNVLSFATLDEMDDTPIQGEQFPLGDIILALETIKREAKEQKKELDHHLTHLIVHGVLHLLGYTHDENEDAEEMESLEIQILKKLHIGNPYA